MRVDVRYHKYSTVDYTVLYATEKSDNDTTMVLAPPTGSTRRGILKFLFVAHSCIVF